MTFRNANGEAYNNGHTGTKEQNDKKHPNNPYGNNAHHKIFFFFFASNKLWTHFFFGFIHWMPYFLAYHWYYPTLLGHLEWLGMIHDASMSCLVTISSPHRNWMACDLYDHWTLDAFFLKNYKRGKKTSSKKIKWTVQQYVNVTLFKS